VPARAEDQKPPPLRPAPGSRAEKVDFRLTDHAVVIALERTATRHGRGAAKVDRYGYCDDHEADQDQIAGHIVIVSLG
jgi:hypothetical protein